MTKKDAITRYSLIIQRLRKSPATFAEINRYLEAASDVRGYDFTVSKRTLQRDLDDIELVHQIEIKFNFKRAVYYIESDGRPDVNNRMLEAFETFSALNITEGVNAHLHFEKRRPSGTENFYGILHAIKTKKSIQFTYTKYWSDVPTHRMIQPYALKEFKSRWYLIGLDTKDNHIKTFGLDRITEFEVTKKSFTVPADFNLDAMYRHSFGILAEEQNPEKIILSFSPLQGKYIKSYPLHDSQQTIIDNDEEFRISLVLWLTYDLKMELLSYGPELRVIAPARLKKQMKESLETTLKYYTK